ncbi:MAG: hypothetical protein ACI8TP_000821 [Acidimicrobiales bacterium]|jgi:hypothetical protein
MTNEAKPQGWAQERDKAIDLLEARRFDEAADRLATAAVCDPTGASRALLGLAHFHLGNYSEAAAHYAWACDLSEITPANRADWMHMVQLARNNDESGVDVFVPGIRYFDGDELLAPPPSPQLPIAPNPRRRPQLGATLRYQIGHGIGLAGCRIIEPLTQKLGKNYRDKIWTNWYRKRLYTGILTLAYMREKLNRRNLKSTYPKDQLVGFQQSGLEPPPGVSHYRTADGSWNNLEDPKEGAAGTRFSRNVAEAVTKPETGDQLLTPNPRRISLELLRREGEMEEVPFLNLLAASWIQFQNHDWITHGENMTWDRLRPIEIPLPENDPARDRYRQQNMFVSRTQPDPTHGQAADTAPVTFINEVTHWWDASQVYGSDKATQDELRTGLNGKLRVEPDGTLPVGKDGVEKTGMVRNWWVGLAMWHTLFTLEHNAICDHLQAHHPTWDDDRLFNVARLVNAAVTAKIHSVEWTPAILPNRALDSGLNTNWYGLLTYRFRAAKDRKTVARFNVPNPELGGLVGNQIEKHGSPFALSEEFVEVYRLHSLLPESLKLRRHATDDLVAEVPFAASRQAASHKITQRLGMPDLFYSFGVQHPGALTLNNYPRFMQELSIPGNPVHDMGTVDILRARERGVPRYNEFRRQLGLNPLHSFDDLTTDKAVVKKITDIYGDDVESLDLLVGTLAESDCNRPTGFGFGETLFQIFILNASRRLQADRFYTTDYREEVYSAEGMDWIDQNNLKSVLLRHYPELAETGLANVTNAFEPWDTATRLDPERHPLRAFDRYLGEDPWTGDAHR